MLNRKEKEIGSFDMFCRRRRANKLPQVASNENENRDVEVCCNRSREMPVVARVLDEHIHEPLPPLILALNEKQKRIKLC